MPLWRVFSHPTTFNAEQRLALAKSVTELYVSKGLPAFYVNVIVRSSFFPMLAPSLIPLYLVGRTVWATS